MDSRERTDEDIADSNAGILRAVNDDCETHCSCGGGTWLSVICGVFKICCRICHKTSEGSSSEDVKDNWVNGVFKEPCKSCEQMVLTEELQECPECGTHAMTLSIPEDKS